jgi:hypothetical protein
LFFWAILLIAAVGCGGKDAPDEQAAGGQDAPASAHSQLPPADVTSKPGDPMIGDDTQQYPVEGLFLSPYFDEEGTKTDLAVAPNSQFRVYIFAETTDPYSTNAIQYRVDFPDGVQVLGTDEFEHKSVSMGGYGENYMLAYDCQPAGRFRVVTYLCSAGPGFKGGEIRMQDGLPASGIAFLGFVSCEFVELRATGGVATLTVK